jgi:hypothetical protein
MVAATAITVGGELLITIFQAYMLASKQQGLTADQAKERFLSNFDKFMAATEKPIDPVKE